MASTNVGKLGNKFTQTYPATTIYWHVCSFTRKLFCSPNRGVKLSPEGKRLQQEQFALIKAARKLTCPVYCRQCPETGEFFTTRDRNQLRTEQGQRIRKERELQKFREYNKRPDVLARERLRNKTAKRKASSGRYQKANRERLNERAKELAAAKPKPAPSCRVYFLTCRVTGKLFTAKFPTALYCEEGYATFKRQYAREYYHSNKELVERKIKPCKECGQSFEGHERTVYCSDKCVTDAKRRLTRLNNTHQRRAKKFGVEYTAFDMVKILERDNWTCQLCGVSTPKEKRGTLEDDAPEIDHIIPMSRGGGHIPSNVQCLCRKCNGAKSNKIVSPKGATG